MQSPRQRTGALTIRQMQVLDDMVRGLSTKETAKRLGIIPTTVKGHRRAIYIRLGVENMAQAIARAVSTGLIRIS